MNGYLWKIRYVPPNSPYLIDRSNILTVATTDPSTRCIYLSSALHGDFLNRVLIHELGHVVMFSYNLIDDIHSVVNEEDWIDAEEWVCNFIADYGLRIFSIASEALGDEAWAFVPYELEKLVM